MNRKLTTSAKPVGKNSDYKGESYIVGVRYGTEGIVPCFRSSHECIGCVSSSGEIFCGNYGGHIDVEAEGKTLYIVRCLGQIYCQSSPDFYYADRK